MRKMKTDWNQKEQEGQSKGESESEVKCGREKGDTSVAIFSYVSISVNLPSEPAVKAIPPPKPIDLF